MAGFSASGRARIAMVAPVLFASALAAGCMGSPTYGTDKTASEQLLNDVTGMVQLGPKDKPQIDYKPRPELVKPAAVTGLPAPQESVASVENSAWPESPEQRRARIRADATANQDNPNYRPEVISDVAPRKATVTFGRENEIPQNGTEPGARVQRAEFNRRLTEQRQGDPTSRKYLSEPPLAYRAPSATAPTDDIGEDEAKKERRAKAAARKQDPEGNRGLRGLLPWL